MRDLIAPMPNLNGNSKDSLLKYLENIRRTIADLNAAIHVGSDLWHGRNFQLDPQGDFTSRLAREGWLQRLTVLEAWQHEVEEIMIKVQDS
jgi:hypothetical protein